MVIKVTRQVREAGGEDCGVVLTFTYYLNKLSEYSFILKHRKKCNK